MSKIGRKKEKPSQRRYVLEDRRTTNKARRRDKQARRHARRGWGPPR